jgi:hypothetical protein
LTRLRRRIGTGAIVCTLLLTSAPYYAQSTGLTTTRTFTHPRLGLTVVGTEIELPAGDWHVAAVTPAGALTQAFVVSRMAPDDLPGRRARAARNENRVEEGRWRVQALYGPLLDYARSHAGVGPRTFAELDPKRFNGELALTRRAPWDDDRATPARPYMFLVPGVRMPAAARGRGAAPAPAPLVVELRPYVDDGRHWVLFTDGTVRRVEIDRTLLARYKVNVTPRQPAAAPPVASNVIEHLLVAQRGAAAAARATVTLQDGWTGARRDVAWTLTGGRADSAVVSDWAMARIGEWLPLVTRAHAPVLQAWIDRASALYGPTPTAGFDPFAMLPDGGRRDPSARMTSAFDVLGGRAALRETLQLELLRARESSPMSGATAGVPIATLPAVDVTSLPFEKLLAGRSGGRLALADHVPEDRLLVYFAKPSALFPFLGQGADFIGRSGSAFTATAFDDALKTRYLRRLGLPEESSRRFLESGAISELALVASDLFFLEGTDVTVLMRARAPDVLAAGLKMLAGIDVPASGVVERQTAGSRPAYWARQGDLLLVGTSRREVERVLNQAGSPSTSLGQSAELRYMLSELPIGAGTRAFVYLSDPFIRRMVGPAVKIGQLRRMRAAADMTLIAAGALLRRLDGRTDAADVATLVQLGYVPRSVSPAEYTLRPDLSVVSRTWGALADLAPIDTAAIQQVTGEEAQAYSAYVQEYREYWRQFFDPIALRLDDAADGSLELTTFILPLIDSTLYASVRGLFETQERKTPLRVPRLSPAPVLQLSLNLAEDAWVGISSGWSEFFSRYTGISAELLDQLGPGLHIAVQDADPVISLGTTDLLGAFGASTMGARFDVFTPLALSIFTRPCRILVELQDPARALALLRQAASIQAAGPQGPMREMPVFFRQIEGRDAWVYTLGVPGIATFRLGLEVQGSYLVLTNIPWSAPATIEAVDTRTLNGAAIHVRPDAVQQGLAALFATQAEADQQAALASMAALLPLLQTVSATPEEAAARHAALFGSTPIHPGMGAWVWRDGRLESSRYGSATRWKVPPYAPDAPFGLLDGTTLVDLNMQFESGGLRAVARWRTK